MLLVATLFSENPICLPLAFCFLSVALAGFNFANWYEQARGFPVAALYFGAIAGCGLAILLTGDLSSRSTGGVIGLNLIGASIGGIAMKWYHGREYGDVR
jgi:hypothetical protein